MNVSVGINHHRGTKLTLPARALEQLSVRLRPAGLSLLLIDSNGGILWHDPSAGGFFTSYVLPLLRNRDPAGNRLREHLQATTLTTPLCVREDFPGAAIAVFPHTDRKQLKGIFLLAAKHANFEMNDAVRALCATHGVDSKIVGEQAELLPGYGIEALNRQARWLVDMAGDQLRLASLEVEVNSLSTHLSNTYEELSLIYQLSSGMKVNRTPREFFKQCCMNVMDVMGTRGLGVALCGESFRQEEPALYGAMSLPGEKLQRLCDDLLVELRSRKVAILCNDLRNDKRFAWVGEFANRMLAVPLMREEQVHGCLFAFDKEKDDFDTVDSKLLTSIANESAIYLENALLFEDARGLMLGLLRSLTSAIDAKDAYTCGHSERVALLSRYIAQQAGLSEMMVERIYMAGLLHDVGKIGISEAVLQKTGRLDPDEFEEIKKHPEIGARILRDVKQIQDIIPGVLHHHERYDGKGYPTGLAGDSIPLMGRIICLADCFDAMTSSRTYRQAMPLEAALAEIRRCASSQFDPTLAEAFLQIPTPTLVELLKDHRQLVLHYSDMAQLRVA
jgi:HD-GYP domain-containing protein (c-di-GMP phosphodiesterase class II)